MTGSKLLFSGSVSVPTEDTERPRQRHRLAVMTRGGKGVADGYSPYKKADGRVLKLLKSSNSETGYLNIVEPHPGKQVLSEERRSWTRAGRRARHQEDEDLRQGPADGAYGGDRAG